jgi:hypothetical protein
LRRPRWLLIWETRDVQRGWPVISFATTPDGGKLIVVPAQAGGRRWSLSHSTAPGKSLQWKNHFRTKGEAKKAAELYYMQRWPMHAMVAAGEDP